MAKEKKAGEGMEAIRIGEHKLKLSLSAEESRKYGISETAECKDTATVRKNVWQILEAAKGISGFEPSGEKLLIQFYPMKNRGCEIFVTKLGVLSEAGARLVSSSERIAIIEKRKAAYALLGKEVERALADLLNSQCKNAEKSAAYRSEKGDTFIVTEELSRESPEPELLGILEFATRLPESAVNYIEEHFEKIPI